MKTALITGGSGGIGMAISKALAKDGWAVAIQYLRDEGSALAAMDIINAAGGKAIICKCDIRSEDEVERMFSTAEKELGEIELLVNNAGISRIKLFDEISLEDWNEMLGVNLTGTFLCSRRAVKSMIRKKSGSIINISSMWGQVGASCEVHYSASKGGVIAMTKALAKELAPSGVRVNCICPGAIDTKMNAHLSPEESAELCEEIPMERLGRAEEIAETVTFLAEKGSYITGQIIGVNGGMVI